MIETGALRELETDPPDADEPADGVAALATIPRRVSRAPQRSLRLGATPSPAVLRRYADALCAHVRARLDGQSSTSALERFEPTVPLMECCKRLGLEFPEQEGLFFLAALELDPTLRPALRQRGIETTTIAVLMQLLQIAHADADSFRRRFGVDGELVAAGLVDCAANGVLTPTVRLMGLLEGVIAFDPLLRDVASFLLVQPRELPDDADDLALAASGLMVAQPLLVIGPNGVGRTRFVAEAARRAGLSGLLLVDAPLVEDPRLWSRLHKEATLLNAALTLLFVDEVGLGEADCAKRLAPALRGSAPVALISARSDLRLERLEIGPRIHLNHPSAAARRVLWEQALAARGITTSERALTQLSRSYRLGPSAIAATVELALAQAALGGSLSLALFERAAQSLSPSALGRFAKRVNTKDAPRDALVLSSELHGELDELLLAARTRLVMSEGWRFGESGLVALFSGPPGCGKTHAATVVAHELGRPLYRVDVSSIVDRFVGETEKHLAQLFHEAADTNGVLLFDEADSLFTRRVSVRDAQDRYANMQVNMLLNLIDDYRGFVILTTNLNGSLDEAFSRRIPYKLSFTKPKAEERWALWQRLLPPDMAIASDVDLEGLAHEFDLSGALIKNAIGRAACAIARGGQLTEEILRHAIYRELTSDNRVVIERKPSSLQGE